MRIRELADAAKAAMQAPTAPGEQIHPHNRQVTLSLRIVDCI
jgi:hypothetical protein